MISISVRGFRGIDTADIECSPVCLVAGHNKQGKSSLCVAVAAALTGRAMLDEFEAKKADAPTLVHDGGKTARAMVKGPDGEARMAWPACEPTSEGSAPPHASLFAAGVLAIPKMPPRERADALQSYLKAEPSREELAAALGDRFTENAVGLLWESITKDGWDGAVQEQEERRRAASSEWCKLVGEKAFGSEKARTWRPAEWDPQLEDKSAADLEAELLDIQTRYEEALGKAAVDMAEMARLRELVGQLEARTAAVPEAETRLATARAALADKRKEREAAPEPVPAGGFPCPHCGEKIIAVKTGPAVTEFKKHEPLDPSENKRRQNTIADLDGMVSNLTAIVHTAERDLGTAKTALEEAGAAKQRLDGLGDQQGAAGVVERIREEQTLRRLDLDMVQKVERARQLHMQWLSADLKLKVVRPEGLRAKKLGEAVDAFNTAVLAPLCETSKFGAVTLTEELRVHLDGRPYALCSASERFRADVIFQIAQARLDGSSMVVIDGADILDASGKSGLFRMLIGLRFPALVAMTLSRVEQAIDLAEFEAGQTYWVDNGILKPFAEVKAAA